jgi:hypothetical protein
MAALGSSRKSVAYTFSESFWRLAQASHMADVAWKATAYDGTDARDRAAGVTNALRDVLKHSMSPASYNAVKEQMEHMWKLMEQFPTDDAYATGYLDGLNKATDALDYQRGR